jgi:hypothetical protein
MFVRKYYSSVQISVPLPFFFVEKPVLRNAARLLMGADHRQIMRSGAVTVKEVILSTRTLVKDYQNLRKKSHL